MFMSDRPMTPALDALFARFGPRYRWYAAGTMMLGTFSMVLATTIVNVVLPQIMQTFGMSQDTVQWTSTGFLAAMAGTMLMTAWCVRRFGQRATYVAALLLFVAASVTGGLATRTDVLIASRIAQGAVGGLIQPLAMITIFSVFPANFRGRAMSLYGFGVVLAPAIGPAVGGLLAEFFSWRAVFFMPVPFCVLGVLLAPAFIPGRDAAQPRPAFDWPGMVLLGVFLALVLFGLNESHRSGFDSAITLAPLILALVAAVGFVRWELRHPAALLDPGVFRNRRFAAASVVAFAYGLGLYGSTYLVPLFVQSVARYTPSEAGALLTPAGVTLAVVLPLAGWTADRFEARYVVAAGLALFALSSALFAAAEPFTAFATLAVWLAL
jgi:EmrB/QacA subfamily drug resistance transporter